MVPLLTSLVVEHLPPTRYRGSKRRFAGQISKAISRQDPGLVQDPFGGSATVSAIADALGVNSHYNDLYRWTTRCARTLLVHEYSAADLRDVTTAIGNAAKNRRPGFITANFSGDYFTGPENLELDGLLRLIDTSEGAISDLIYYAVAQAALMKMPMSMFHRACLSQRTAKIQRRCGNITTWNKPFAALAPRCAGEAVAFTMRRRTEHKVTQVDALAHAWKKRETDLMFLDPPYVNPRGGVPTYDIAYHFLEGMAHGEVAWEKGLVDVGRQRFFSAKRGSTFENAEGWTSGVEHLVRGASRGVIVATARRKDSPGASALRSVLAEHFDEVRQSQLQRGVIFSKSPNPEYLFEAA